MYSFPATGWLPFLGSLSAGPWSSAGLIPASCACCSALPWWWLRLASASLPHLSSVTCQLEIRSGLCGEERFCRRRSGADLQRSPRGRPHADARGLRDRRQRHFAPLSYYKLSVPVAPLPRALNSEAIRAGSEFLQQEAQRRFLAMAFVESYGTLDWLANPAAATHTVHELGAFDSVKVLEFVPRAQRDALR